MKFDKIISSDTKKLLLFYFPQLIIIKILFFIILFIRFKIFNSPYTDDDLEMIQLLYDIIINPVYLLVINVILTLKQKRKSNILNILLIIICIFTGIIVSYFNCHIIYPGYDFEHGMFHFLPIYIFIPLYSIIGIIEHIILIIIFNRKQKIAVGKASDTTAAISGILIDRKTKTG
jgi:hypothetical protein